jgi:hypothetical protein
VTKQNISENGKSLKRFALNLLSMYSIRVQIGESAKRKREPLAISIGAFQMNHQSLMNWMKLSGISACIQKDPSFTID